MPQYDAILPEPAHLVLFIILQVAFEPFDVTVAFEGQDMGAMRSQHLTVPLR